MSELENLEKLLKNARANGESQLVRPGVKSSEGFLTFLAIVAGGATAVVELIPSVELGADQVVRLLVHGIWAGTTIVVAYALQRTAAKLYHARCQHGYDAGRVSAAESRELVG